LGGTLKRVLLFGDNHLLATGVENLLVREDDLLVLGVTNNDGDLPLEHEIDLFKPSVIIFDESMFLTHFSYFYLLIKKYPQLRVIVMDEGDNILQIFDKQVTMVVESADLINVIRQD
jgi:DNA-binding NarL/FixJ family response regulator